MFLTSQKFWSNGSSTQPLSVKLLFTFCLLKIAASAENLRSSLADTNSTSKCEPCPDDCCPDDTTCVTINNPNPESPYTSYVCGEGSDSDLKYLGFLGILALPLLWCCCVGGRKCINAISDCYETTDLRRNLMG